MREFGYPLLSLASTNGTFTFSATQTSQPYAQSSTFGGQTVGFPYASFLLGLVNSGTVNPPADLRTGKHFIALFAAGFLEDHPQADFHLRPALRLRHLSQRAIWPLTQPGADTGKSHGGRTSGRRHLRSHL